jgi:hypothetical protein
VRVRVCVCVCFYFCEDARFVFIALWKGMMSSCSRCMRHVDTGKLDPPCLPIRTTRVCLGSSRAHAAHYAPTHMRTHRHTDTLKHTHTHTSNLRAACRPVYACARVRLPGDPVTFASVLCVCVCVCACVCVCDDCDTSQALWVQATLEAIKETKPFITFGRRGVVILCCVHEHASLTWRW